MGHRLLGRCDRPAGGGNGGWHDARLGTLARNRQMGLRTLELVGLVSGIAMQAIVRTGPPGVNADAAGRAMQSFMIGVGFIGAGVALRVGQGQEVHGVATAASIWVSATLGAAAGLAVRPLIAGGLLLAILMMFVGALLERRICERAWRKPGEADRKDVVRKP